MIGTNSPLPGGTQGTPYSTTLQASGGTGSYTWSLANGSTLPANLSLDPNTGIIAGTPQAGGTTSFFTVKVIDGSGASVTKDFSLVINSLTPTIATLSPNNANAGLGDFTLTVNGSGFTTGSVVNWNGTPLATTYVSATQLTAAVPRSDIATPGAAGVTVTNPPPGGGTSTPVTFTINNPLQIMTTSLPNGPVGQPYSAQLQATGGVQPYTWSIVGGALPPGLSLDAHRGVISGTPTSAGTFGFTVQVQDSSSLSNQSPISIQPTPPGGTGGQPYPPTPVQPSPPGSGTPPACASYTVVSGSLPPGLSLDPTTGVISGTPLNGGTYDFVIGCTPSSGGGQTVTQSFTITITNPTPAITSLNPSSVIAGGPGFSLTVTGSNFVESSVVQWGGNPLTTAYVSATQLTASVPAADIASPATATVTVVNPAPGGGTSNSVTFTIKAPNHPPSVSVTGPTTANEGDTVTFQFTVRDPDAGDTFTVKSGYPTCGGGGQLVAGSLATTASGGSFQCGFPDGPASSTVSIVVTDSQGADSNTATLTVAVQNVAPTNVVVTPSRASINENDSITLSGSFTDPGLLDTHTIDIDWGDGTAHSTVSLGAGVLSFSGVSHQYLDNPAGQPTGSFTITVKVTDKDNGTGTGTSSVQVNNVAPTNVTITGLTITPQPAGTTVSGVGGSFTDPGTLDTHTVDIDWGDGTAHSTVSLAANVLTFSGQSHAYTASGVYTVTIKVTDKDGGVGAATFQYVVVYDPSAGFVTGGGWIDSPANACHWSGCASDGSTTGRANFGFVSKYEHGSSTPTGNTEFQFQAGNLDFKSNSYSTGSLVVSGAMAQYKGTGTINGQGTYSFTVWACDAQLAGSCKQNGVDGFRIRIIDTSTNTTVYDNVLGGDGSLSTGNAQPIAGGSITIHKS